MSSEKDLQQELFIHLKNIACLGSKQIGMEVSIPYKHIYLPRIGAGSMPNLEVWCFKQDIAIYDILYAKSVGYKTARIVDKTSDLLGVVLEKDNAQNTSNVGLPYVIIETKKQQPVTDTLLAYSNKAGMIKTIFPYCRYILVIFGPVSPRTYRHGLNFDAIVRLDLKSKVSMKNFSSLVCDMLAESTADASRLRPTKSLKTIKTTR